MEVIGLDFGNYNTYVSFVDGLDVNDRLAGEVRDLLPADSVQGIPSVYFYSAQNGNERVELGNNAISRRALPINNRLRYLKRNINKEFVIDGKTIKANDAITEVAQHCIRIANDYMSKNFLKQTNKVFLSYPATFLNNQKMKLIELIERATLQDGTHIEVVGTIAEPAAAALDYLAQSSLANKETTVLTYDLGGGTFDLSLVAAFPKGRTNIEGEKYYYDVIFPDGIENLGGYDFDIAMRNIMLAKIQSKIKTPLNERKMAELMNLAEEAKIYLCGSDINPTQDYEFFYDINDETLIIPVSLKEFENATRALVQQTVDKTKYVINEHPNQKPDIIVLTGGASQMPMIKRALENELPQYRGKIVYFRPAKSISYGAARYGCQFVSDEQHSVQLRTAYDLGVRLREAENQENYIEVFIKAGTPLPCKSEALETYKTDDGRYTNFNIYEANKKNANNREYKPDYNLIMTAELDHGRDARKGTPHMSRMSIDGNGRLTYEYKESDKPDTAYKKASVNIKFE